jgi:apolipoprotein N-acyltransferase
LLAIPVVFASLSGLLYAFCFPPFNFSYLAWVALVPLFMMSIGTWRRNFLFGFIAGFFSNLIVFFWLWPTFKAANVGFFLALGCWLSLSALLALYLAVFMVIYGWLQDTWYKPFLAAAAWVVLDEIKTHALTGFPWALFSHSQAHYLPLIQIASVTGAAGVSFLLVAVNSALSRRNKWGKVAVATVLLPVLLYGTWRLKQNPSTEDSALLNVAILQGDIDQYQKWDDAYENDIRIQYETLAAVAASTKPDLIVWPESSLPGWYPNDPAVKEWLDHIIVKTKTFNLVGAVTKENGKPLNAAFLFKPDGTVLGRYDKRHLVPYGEYVPFGQFLSKWIPYLGELGIFSPGTNDSLLVMGYVQIGVNVCYEAIFPSLVRRSVNQGADVIVNLTNDGWFLNSAAPEQHYNANIFRAVENGKPLVRAANTGISAVIDAHGREIARSKLLERTVLEGTVLVTPGSRTVFSRWGNWFIIFCLLSLCIKSILLYSRTCHANCGKK